MESPTARYVARRATLLRFVSKSTSDGANATDETVGTGLPDGPMASQVVSGGSGWAWVEAGGVWTRPGKLPWRRELAGEWSLGGAGSKDVWAVGAHGMMLHRK